MRPPESSSRSRAALAWTTGERVKAFAMAVPMPMRLVACATAPSTAKGCWLKNSALHTDAKPAASARCASSTCGRELPPTRISPGCHTPPLPRPLGESSLSGSAEEPMKQRRLGRTGLVVSEIGLGTMTFGSMADEAASLAHPRPRLRRAASTSSTSRRSIRCRPMRSGSGAARRSSASGWRGRPRDAVFLATQGRRAAAAAGSRRRSATARAASIATTSSAPCEESLRRLGTDYIDLYQTHWPDPNVPIDETLEALDRLVDEGKVRYVGCSNQTGYGLTKSLWKADSTARSRYETIQNNFSLLNRRFEDELADVLPRAAGEPARLQPARRRRALRQVPGRRLAGRRALHASTASSARARR